MLQASFQNPGCMCLIGWQRSRVSTLAVTLSKWDSGLFWMPCVWVSSATKTPNVGNCTSLGKEFHEDLVSLSFLCPLIFISIPIHAFWENYSHLWSISLSQFSMVSVLLPTSCAVAMHLFHFSILPLKLLFLGRLTANSFSGTCKHMHRF